MSRPYRPSNGTEGGYFIEAFCVRCWYDRNEDCPILASSFISQVPEWVSDDDGENARCLQFHDQVKGEPKEFPADSAAQLRLAL
jgi:hypothetical protein